MTHRNGNLKMGRNEWGLLLVLSVLWGGSFFFFKILVAEFPPFTVVLGRVGLAALCLNALLLARGDQRPVGSPPWKPFLLMGLLNNVVPFTLIVFGEASIASGLAAIVNATTPIFTVLASHVLTGDEKLTWPKSVGVGFGILGVSVLIGPGALSEFGRGDALGEGSCLLAAASYALAGLYGRRFRGLAPLRVAAGQLTASTAILVPITLLVDHPWRFPLPSAQAWGAWVGIALLSTALASTIYFRILAVAGATNLLLVTFLLPVSALLLGVAFLGERIGAQAVAGMALIGLGLAAIDGRVLHAARLRRQPRSSAPGRAEHGADGKPTAD